MIIAFNKIDIVIQNKRNERTIAKLYKKLKLTNSAEKTINSRILEYVKTKKDLYGFALTSKQQNDPEFMLELYKANSQALTYHCPNKNLQKNIDFMVEFFKLELARKKRVYLENKQEFDFANIKPSIDSILLGYRQLRQNKEFLEKLNKELENE